MLDSVKLQSPHISEATARLVEQQIETFQRLDNASGELLYELHAGQLDGSYDHRVSVRVNRKKFVPDSNSSNRMVAVNCAPYLYLEGSVHKALLGHNVHGGPQDFEAPCYWFVFELMERLGVALPRPMEWTVQRIDWSETYSMSHDAIRQYVRSLNSCNFPRRPGLQRYGDESIASPGRTTAVKIYHKGPEFMKHDFRRLRPHLDPYELLLLGQIAAETLRVEVAIKKRKISDEHGGDAKIPHIDLEWIKKVHATEIGRLIRESKTDMKIVRDTHSVRDRLLATYSDRQASALFATWVQFAALGERSCKDSLAERTFYDHRKKLLNAGVAWTGSDVRIVGTRGVLVPADFRPVTRDARCSSSEAPEVSRILEHYRAA